jgi:hypothetical protein
MLARFFAGFQHQVDPRYVRSPGCKFSSDLTADFRGLAGQRLMLFRVHEHVVDLMRRGLEGNRLLKRFRSHLQSPPRISLARARVQAMSVTPQSGH